MGHMTTKTTWRDRSLGAAKAAACACILSLSGATAGSEVPPMRLAYNYCTLSYTFAYYSDAEWVAEIERLAAAGYNAALVIDGTFKVWQEVLREAGCDEKTILEFIPDECARAWWLMDNLAGEGGPLDQATIDDDGRRGRMICAKMREKGIEPVLQGYIGMVPAPGAGSIWKDAVAQGKWGPYERPPILDPTGAEYAKMAEIWHRKLEEVYGIKPKYLAGDLFHEGGQTAGINVTAATKAVQAAQQKAFPGVVWVVQAWQANPVKAVRDGLDKRWTLIEALVKDMGSKPAPKDYGALPWIWCEVLNFGGNHGLYGNLRTFASLGGCTNKTFRGYGALSEGFFTNKIASDLFEEMMMRPAGSVMSDAELDDWIKGWVKRHYGKEDERLFEAWKILARTVYACDRCQEGTVENVMCAEPGWSIDNVSTWGPRGGLWYEAKELEKAAKLLGEAAAQDETTADVRRQCLANEARAIAPFLQHSKAARSEFIALIEREASLLEGFGSFSLAAREAEARKRAGERGVKAFRRMITTWAAPELGKTILADYANREYAELLRSWYEPRWKAFFEKAEAEEAKAEAKTAAAAAAKALEKKPDTPFLLKVKERKEKYP